MRLLDLFSGIGGFSLGLERAGFKTVAFCEIEPFCQAVLKKHWPNIPIYDDVRTLTAKRLAEDGIGTVDVICGGFPCQDISVAGKGAGITGSRSGLWTEYARLIGELRPRYVVVENVAALLVRGMDRVLEDLSEVGYDAEWHVISASDVGAPHLRKRIWIVAHPSSCGFGGESAGHENSWVGFAGGSKERALADPANHGRPRGGNTRAGRHGLKDGGEVAPDAHCATPARHREYGRKISTLSESIRLNCGSCKEWWAAEPSVGRVANGIPSRVDRLRGLGNSVVPQIPELIGRAIMKAEGLS